MNYFCRHHYEPMYLVCPQCEQNAGVSSEHVQKSIDAANQRERDELVLKFMLAMVAAGYSNPLQYAIERTDEYLKWLAERSRNGPAG